MFTFVDDLGHKVVGSLRYTYQVFLMVYLSMRATFFDQAQGLRTIISVVSAQIYFTGFQALPLISALALGAGGIVVLQFNAQLTYFGNAAYIGDLMVILIVREIGPIFTALLVVARSGTAVASEIGSMRVNKEIEALETMGINPLSYIVFPRIIGGVISVLCLAFYFDVIAVFGGYFVTRIIQDMPFSFYTEAIAQAFAAEDVFLYFLKNTFSGMIIFVVCCYQGLLVKQSPHEIPQVTTKAVINSIIFVLIFNILTSALFYLNQITKLGLI